jgi:excisionase family DNA binding protein
VDTSKAPSPPRALTVREVAARLSISRSFAYRLTAPAGPIPTIRVGSRLRVREDDLADFLEISRTASTT